MGGGVKRHDRWFGVPLGRLPDCELAAYLGIKQKAVANARWWRGIPSFPRLWRWRLKGGSNNGANAVFKSCVLDCIGYRMPMRTGSIYQRVVDDYGRVAVRTLNRALAALCARGAIRRVNYEDEKLGHVIQGYIRLRHEEVTHGARDREEDPRHT